MESFGVSRSHLVALLGESWIGPGHL